VNARQSRSTPERLPPCPPAKPVQPPEPRPAPAGKREFVGIIRELYMARLGAGEPWVR